MAKCDQKKLKIVCHMITMQVNTLSRTCFSNSLRLLMFLDAYKETYASLYK